MNRKDGRFLLAVAFFLLSFTISVVTLGMQLQLRGMLKEMPAQTAAVQAPLSEASAVETSGTTREAVTAETAQAPSEAPPEVSAVAARTSRPTQAQTVTTTRKTVTTTTERSTEISAVLVLNTNSKKIHSDSCAFGSNIKAENRQEISREKLDEYLQNGYTMCQHCKGYVS